MFRNGTQSLLVRRGTSRRKVIQFNRNIPPAISLIKAFRCRKLIRISPCVQVKVAQEFWTLFP